MPTTHRADRAPHVKLKELRKICGFTQVQLANKVGVATATIVAIEVGNLQLSTKMARRVATATGVHPDSLSDEGSLTAWDGSDFTAETQDARKHTPTYRAGELLLRAGHDETVAAALGDIRAVLKAAAVANKLSLAAFLVREYAYSLIGELDLEKAFLNADKREDFLVVPATISGDLTHRLKAASRRRKLPVQNADTIAAAMALDHHWSEQEAKAIAVVTAQDKSPKTQRQPSASPKRGSAKTKSSSRPGGPFRKR